MTEDRAIEVLTMMLENLPTKQFTGIANGSTPAGLARDLCDWFNGTELEPADISDLFNLAKDGNFQSWTCPTCGDPVFLGEPADWGNFQGVRNADYTSYPGYNIGSLDKRCDSCRMTMRGAAYIPEGTHLEPD